MSNFEENYQKTHKTYSLWKSALRIVTCVVVALMDPQSVLTVFAMGFLFAEILGIYEEFI